MIQHRFERSLLNLLPPNARKVADNLLTEYCLMGLLRLYEDGFIEKNLLQQHQVDERLWADILQASLLAKLTYFEASDLLTREQVYFLIETALKVLFYEVNYPLAQVFVETKRQHPFFARWLVAMAKRVR